MLHKIQLLPQHINYGCKIDISNRFATGSIVTIDLLERLFSDIDSNFLSETTLNENIIEWLLENQIHYYFSKETEEIWFGRNEDASFFKLVWG